MSDVGVGRVKKILFLCPYYFDLYRVYQSGLERFSNCSVDTIVYRDEQFKYSGMQRVLNFFSKHFLRKNMKPIWKSKARIASVSCPEQYDYMLVLCPELLHGEHLKYLCSKVGRSIVFYWDGFDHFPGYIDTVKYFDACYSFDPVDAKKYDLRFLPNFWFDNGPIPSPEYDLFFLSTYDSRFPVLKKIVDSFSCRGMTFSVHQYTKDANLLRESNVSGVNFYDHPVPVLTANEMMKKARFVLDLQKTIQRGLTFRVFESMRLGRKLITTNSDIVNYDFYRPNNIFVWDESVVDLPSSFLESPYEPLPDEIYQKYSQESWVRTILEL